MLGAGWYASVCHVCASLLIQSASQGHLHYGCFNTRWRSEGAAYQDKELDQVCRPRVSVSCAALPCCSIIFCEVVAIYGVVSLPCKSGISS